MIAYYSTVSGNTLRFVERLGLPAVRVSGDLVMDVPYVLITPTYSGEIPAPVRFFLQNEENRSNLYGVVGAGSMNFGSDYARAARLISTQHNVPLLYVFELFGLSEDVDAVRTEIDSLWDRTQALT